MIRLTSDQVHERLKEDGPYLWWCRRYCAACNGHEERFFWCARQLFKEPCLWSAIEITAEVVKSIRKEAGKKEQKETRKEKSDAGRRSGTRLLLSES